MPIPNQTIAKLTWFTNVHQEDSDFGQSMSRTGMNSIVLFRNNIMNTHFLIITISLFVLCSNNIIPYKCNLLFIPSMTKIVCEVNMGTKVNLLYRLLHISKITWSITSGVKKAIYNIYEKTDWVQFCSFLHLHYTQWHITESWFYDVNEESFCRVTQRQYFDFLLLQNHKMACKFLERCVHRVTRIFRVTYLFPENASFQSIFEKQIWPLKVGTNYIHTVFQNKNRILSIRGQFAMNTLECVHNMCESTHIL